ncbi:pyridoxal-phosphate dependent enzyme [Paenibacillus aurantius]|uniref:Pyridoxal-phosphate dependent enzyme n=1 Tax=Paenibacillus aurantius TaxID=2918900 RepID=A0AA96LKW0_9BACL|nr:pyridoxal-phosphate dependent enzyme [Paenibacillus aurantius]WNQ13262.1 pyridoxal-phosphate dependent enzyme [Paenibacillus aurantius]
MHYDAPSAGWQDEGQSGIWKYQELLPPVPLNRRVYLGEGATPLIRSVSLEKRLGLGELYFKYEGSNPTGSYKDRIAAMGISWALAHGRKACIGTTSGNAGAAVAAYAARAGLPYHLFVLEHMAQTKLAQVLVHNAQVRRVAGFGTSPEVGDTVFSRIFEAAGLKDWEVMITAFRYNPYAMEGVKTISFELAEQLQNVPTQVYTAAGGAGLFVGVWKGFEELFRHGLLSAKPHMVAVQSAGCSNLVRAYEAGAEQPAPGASTSQISGLQVPNPPDGKVALSLMKKGDGSSLAVEDEAIWEVQRQLAEEEGIFCEPAGAVSVAGMMKALQGKEGNRSQRVVCVISGAGFKDSARLSAMTADKPVPLLPADGLDI